ncbi:MAG TPA: UDP-3-O-(3-hydroxymyristoyl)glucosamine N-acyltransferase [Candidatus Dormibacteraeota bacterium]|nr:UDP-3-O-(3-hydroxymyristoyl)glucosamine N-acyltransferase [Candidatus Dormibacteraeota bacterium]
MRLSDLAALLGCELHGDGGVEITRVAPIESAGAGDLTFVANPRYLRFLADCRASAVILAPDAPATPLPTLRTPDPYMAFSRAVEHFHVPLAWRRGVHPTAQVAASAVIGPEASIGAYAVIGERVRIGTQARIAAHAVIYDDVTIGERFTAHAHATVRERVRIGDDVVLHAGSVIGSDGFGYAPAGGGIRRLLQGGDVVLEDEVEVGANATVDRAMVGSTVLRRGVKLDNLVMVAHGCEVGAHSMLAAQVGLSGSTRIGQWVRMGGQVGAAGHLTIGDGAQVAAQSGVANSVAPGATVGGYPAVEIGVWRRAVAASARLPELFRRVRRLERRLGAEVPDQP